MAAISDEGLKEGESGAKMETEHLTPRLMLLPLPCGGLLSMPPSLAAAKHPLCLNSCLLSGAGGLTARS